MDWFSTLNCLLSEQNRAFVNSCCDFCANFAEFYAIIMHRSDLVPHANHFSADVTAYFFWQNPRTGRQGKSTQNDDNFFISSLKSLFTLDIPNPSLLGAQWNRRRSPMPRITRKKNEFELRSTASENSSYSLTNSIYEYMIQDTWNIVNKQYEYMVGSAFVFSNELSSKFQYIQ